MSACKFKMIDSFKFTDDDLKFIEKESKDADSLNHAICLLGLAETLSAGLLASRPRNNKELIEKIRDVTIKVSTPDIADASIGILKIKAWLKMPGVIRYLDGRYTDPTNPGKQLSRPSGKSKLYFRSVRDLYNCIINDI